MRYALILAGAVINVIEAPDADIAAAVAALHGATAVQSDVAGPGDTYSGGVFTRPAPVEPVPREVTMAQARIAMSRASISEAAVEALIAGMPEGQAKVEAGIWWRTSNAVQRHHPVVAVLAPLLGLDDAGTDNLFRAASKV